MSGLKKKNPTPSEESTSQESASDLEVSEIFHAPIRPENAIQEAIKNADEITKFTENEAVSDPIDDLVDTIKRSKNRIGRANNTSNNAPQKLKPFHTTSSQKNLIKSIKSENQLHHLRQRATEQINQKLNREPGDYLLSQIQVISLLVFFCLAVMVLSGYQFWKESRNLNPSFEFALKENTKKVPIPADKVEKKPDEQSERISKNLPQKTTNEKIFKNRAIQILSPDPDANGPAPPPKGSDDRFREIIVSTPLNDLDTSQANIESADQEKTVEEYIEQEQDSHNDSESGPLPQTSINHPKENKRTRARENNPKDP